MPKNNSDEVAKRLDDAVAAADRQKDTAEFLASLTANDEIIRPIYNPEAWLIRDKARAAVDRGEIKRTKCKHPLNQLKQLVDTDSSVNRSDRLVNLFMCQMCETPCWLVDPWGDPLGDA